MIKNTGMKDILRYSATPEIKPRIEALLSSGFQYIAYFIALVYGAIRLLPNNHPYLNIANIGRFGIRHVIAEAANNLVLDIKNIDQIALFITVLIGMMIIVVQFLMLGASFFVQPVLASMPTNFAGFFVTSAPENDIAHMMMDLVFGVPGIFDSCVAQTIPCLGADGTAVLAEKGPNAGASIFAGLGFPFPIHLGIHQMFQIYSIGLLVVATLITIYFMITVVAETAQTGTPFGKRFNKVWAPVRIVVAFGLLVPISYGLNASQFIVLYAAKYGSGFATNGWTLFNTQLTGAAGAATAGLFGDGTELASEPNVPEMGGLLQFFYTARTCYHLEQNATFGRRDVKPYLVKGPSASASGSALQVSAGTAYDDMISFANGEKRVLLRFGVQDAAAFPNQKGNVFPYCGEVALKLTDARPSGQAEPGVYRMQNFHWELMKDGWFTMFQNINGENYPENTAVRFTQWNHDSSANLPDTSLPKETQLTYEADLKNEMEQAVTEMVNSGRFSIDPVLQSKGWAGAAIWYNRVAELNGAITTTILRVPQPTLYAHVMEYVQKRKKQQDQNTPPSERFRPTLANGDNVPEVRAGMDAPMMTTLWEAFSFWQNNNHTTSTYNAPTGNAIIDSINAFFGTEGLYNIRNNPDTHPLAQLVGVGRSLVEASVTNIGNAMIGGGAAALLSAIGEQFGGQLTSVMSTFVLTFAMVGLTAGFVLFYVVPFLPFIYFFFAVGGWVKGIFEAMAGAPLWALAHIRIDGDGLPGQAAVSGYFLIFEIFIRPILILFGILASISIFSALVGVLHQIFDLVIDNLTGFDNRAANAAAGGGAGGGGVTQTLQYLRSSVDGFFYTIVYTIIVYLMAMSSFKLIDLIPNNILRWIGQSVGTFNDSREDAAQQLVGKATIGAQQTSSALGSGLKGIAGAGGG